MKKILVTGANSYIGNSFEKWACAHEHGIQIDTLDMMDVTWREKEFGEYDAIFHVAGIAHADTGKVSEAQKMLYYKVNCDLAQETARKAKAEGVKQFLYMSSIIVYGESAIIGKQKVITPETEPCPANFYGDSKLQAEIKLNELRDKKFKVVILRPPMIYGKGSKGNYPMLAKISRKVSIFPKIENARSMLHIDNLCAFILYMILNEEDGTFYPQNEEYVSTYYMVKAISEIHQKKIVFTKWFNWLFLISARIPGKIGQLTNKAFGSIVYDPRMSVYKQNYRVNDFITSIKKTEQ